MRNLLGSVCGAAVALCVSVPALGASTVAFIKLEGTLADRRETAPLMLAPADRYATLPGVIGALEDAADPEAEIDGLVLRLSEFAPTRTQIEEIGSAIEQIRAQGRAVHVFCENYGPPELLLASHADEIIVQAGGSVTLPGMYMEEFFLADALRAIGVEPSFVQIGDYKGAKEMLANSGPSPEWDRNISRVLDSLYGAMVGRLADGRGMTTQEVERAMEACFFAAPETAIEHGLVDRQMDVAELEAHLESVYGDDFAWDDELNPGAGEGGPDYTQMSFFEAFATMMEMLAGPQGPALRADGIAVVHVKGAIVDGESSSGGLFGGKTTGSITIRKALSEIEDDARVRGVVVRIDSPGGSATASESIWRGLRRVAERKPVWVSIGSMAASGGYYVAVAGDRIYLSPSSIVGSIGVVAGKLAMGGLMDRLHVNVVPRHRGPNGDIFGMLSPWSDSQRALIREKMSRTYDLFVARVKAGREGIEVGETAEGRLFVGRDAVAMHMADEIGGMDEAVEALAAHTGLAPGTYDVVHYPAPKTFEEMLEEMFGSVRAPDVAARHSLVTLLREAMGGAAWSGVRDGLEALMLLRREPILLVNPRTLIVR